MVMSPQSILKKSVTVQHSPSAVYHYGEPGGGAVHHSKVNVIFQAAKKDLLQVIQLQVPFTGNLSSFSQEAELNFLWYYDINIERNNIICWHCSTGPQSVGRKGHPSPGQSWV